MAPIHKRALLVLSVVSVVLGASLDAFAIVGRPLTPVSFAGVARRTVRRTAVVRGAAYGAAAYGTAAAISTLPRGCAVGVYCGGTIYQPAYSGTTVVYVPQ